LELANSFLLSSLENRLVQLPIDSTVFEQHLKRLIESSGRQKPKVVREAFDDMANSFR
jgi:hypothetical protein